MLRWQLQKFSIVRLDEFICNTVQNRRIIIVLNLTAIQACNEQIGNPVRIDDGAPAAAGFSGPLRVLTSLLGYDDAPALRALLLDSELPEESLAVACLAGASSCTRILIDEGVPTDAALGAGWGRDHEGNSPLNCALKSMCGQSSLSSESGALPRPLEVLRAGDGHPRTNPTLTLTSANPNPSPRGMRTTLPHANPNCTRTRTPKPSPATPTQARASVP